MTDPITITRTPTYYVFAVASTDNPLTEPSILAGRNGVCFRNAGNYSVWLCNSDGSQSMTIDVGDERAYILDSTEVVTFYFKTSAATVNIEREEWK